MWKIYSDYDDVTIMINAIYLFVLSFHVHISDFCYAFINRYKLDYLLILVQCDGSSLFRSMSYALSGTQKDIRRKVVR